MIRISYMAVNCDDAAMPAVARPAPIHCAPPAIPPLRQAGFFCFMTVSHVSPTDRFAGP